MRLLFLKIGLVFSQFIAFLISGNYSILEINYLENEVILTSSFEKNAVSVSDIPTVNLALRNSLVKGNYKEAKKLADSIGSILRKVRPDSTILAESLYFLGIYYKVTDNIDSTLFYLERVISIKEKTGERDSIYSKALYNLGGLYSRMGLFRQHEDVTLKALAVEKMNYGEDSPELISTYGSLITAYIQLNQFKKAIELTDLAYRIAREHEKDAFPSHIGFLYNNIGVLYSSMRDYSKSIIFYDKAEEFYSKASDVSKEAIINLYRNKSNTLNNLDRKDEADHYFRLGVEMAGTDYSISAYLYLSEYAQKLGNRGEVMAGDSVLRDMIRRIEKREGKKSQDYFEALVLYADYLRLFKLDMALALKYYQQSMDFFDSYGDELLRFEAAIGVAKIFSEKDEFENSLNAVQKLLFPNGIPDLFLNPDPNSLNADNDYLNLLRTKYQILKTQYKKTNEEKVLVESAKTAEVIISLLERLRINISEEESRLMLGNKFRDSYVDVIDDYYKLLTLTGENHYLDKAFEYAEKSKIAGLLASTRELKATEFHIPEKLAEQEKNLQAEISLLNDLLSGKSSAEEKNEALENKLKNNLFLATLKRDSLIKVFEREYPDYYAIKYNTRVITTSEVPDIIGRNANYLSFVASDSILYATVINSKFRKFFAFPVDSSFYKSISSYRKLLSEPDFSNAGNEFSEYLMTGNFLYKKLIEPFKSYLISDRIIISPDNLISYLPLETLPVSDKAAKRLSYRDLDFLMNEFDISYTYSATFLAENIRRNYGKSSRTIAFAPDYGSGVNITGLFKNRQQNGDILLDIPFAREEAEYVSRIFRGKLVEKADAKESVFKMEAGNYDIVHLAMHTILDDNEPMYSTLIFSPDSSGKDDRFLRTYEIYGIPLKARMVVLSSCNTGSGRLYSGEGILSLARGFIYSGSASVVMSMWEIEDRAGSEIVRLYYDYLKQGFSKSRALRKARSEFLRGADQLRAHPYFWSTLVIYGDNSPLFRPVGRYLLIIVSLIVMAALTVYIRWRRYS